MEHQKIANKTATPREEKKMSGKEAPSTTEGKEKGKKAQEEQMKRFVKAKKLCSMCLSPLVEQEEGKEETKKKVKIVRHESEEEEEEEHEVCEKCSEIIVKFSHLQSTMEKEEKKCEICGKKVIKIEIRDIETQQLEEEGKKEEEKEGEICSRCIEEKATMKCVACGFAVCENEECQRSMRIQHEKARRNQHELELKPITTTKKKEEEGNVEECGLIGHEKEKLKYFCEEDEVPVCSHCLLIGLCCFFLSLKHK